MSDSDVKVTVFCAVWHQDPDRHALLEGHAKTLDRQSSSVERIYIFDNGDEPPADLAGTTYVSPTPVTIYQAWALALAQARTPYVMNLNLDDRLCTDAVEHMEAALEGGADLVGGDWKVCYSQEDTDDTNCVYPADDVPFEPPWPPAAGSNTRVGSGTGSRGTYGPATLWRRDLHERVGSYPWQFGDGTLIKIIGDAVWWQMIANAPGTVTRKLPLILGHYHSHPASQAEFRADMASEIERARTAGIRSQVTQIK